MTYPNFRSKWTAAGRPPGPQLDAFEGAELLGRLFARGHTFASISKEMGASISSVHALARARGGAATWRPRLGALLQVNAAAPGPDLAALEEAHFAFGRGKARTSLPHVAIDKARFTGWPAESALARALAERLPRYRGEGGVAAFIEAAGRTLVVQSSVIEKWWRKPTTLRFRRVLDILCDDYVVGTLGFCSTGSCEDHRLRHQAAGCADAAQCQDRTHFVSNMPLKEGCVNCDARRVKLPQMQLTVHGIGCQLGLLGVLKGLFLFGVADAVCTHLDVAVDLPCDMAELLLEPAGRHRLKRVLEVEYLRSRSNEIAIYDKLSAHRRKLARDPKDSVLQLGTQCWPAITRIEARIKAAKWGGAGERLAEATALFTALLVVPSWEFPEPSFLLGRQRPDLPRSLRDAARSRAIDAGLRSGINLAHLSLSAGARLWASTETAVVADGNSWGPAVKRRLRFRKRELLEEQRVAAALAESDWEESTECSADP